MELSIISVEYNDILSLYGLILSINKNLFNINYEIIVISNSNYGFKKQNIIKGIFRGVKFYFNNMNLGYAKAVNQGLKLSKGKYILIINPDVILLDNNLLLALSFMENHPKISVVGPRIVDSKGEIEDSLRLFVSPKTLISRTYRRIANRFRTKNNVKLLEYKETFYPNPVDWISGACMLLKKSAIDEVGPMDERFFMYCEDMDWCRRFWTHHYEVWSFPDWKVQHNATRASTSNIFALNKLKIIHMISMLKYFVKWGVY